MAILGPRKSIPSLAAARLQRWAVLLSVHNYEIKFKSTHDYRNTDELCHLPLKQDTADNSARTEMSIFNIA